jgi:hypothetical protein
MGSGNEPELSRRPDPREGHELFEVVSVRPSGVWIVDIGKPLGFGQDIGKLREFR